MDLETYSQMEKSGDVKEVGGAQIEEKQIDTEGRKERRKKGNVYLEYF